MRACPGSPNGSQCVAAPGEVTDACPLHPRRFPAQFGRLGLELTETARLAVQLPGAEPLELSDSDARDAPDPRDPSDAADGRARSSEGIPWPQIYGNTSSNARRSTMRSAKPRLAARPGRRPRRPRRSHPVSPRCARLPDHQLLRILFRDQPPRHFLPDRPAARRARPVLPALHQRPDAGQPGRLRCRLLGDAVAEVVVPRSVPVQDRGPFRRDRYWISTILALRRARSASRRFPPARGW